MKKKIYERIIQISEMWLIWQETEQYEGILYKLITGLSGGKEKERIFTKGGRNSSSIFRHVAFVEFKNTKNKQY